MKPAIESVLDLHRAPTIIADQEKITFALKQIIDNAYKFSGEEAEVSISLHEEGENVLISVADTGCGIPPEEIPKIFEKFYQIDPHKTGQVPGLDSGYIMRVSSSLCTEAASPLKALSAEGPKWLFPSLGKRSRR